MRGNLLLVCRLILEKEYADVGNECQNSWSMLKRRSLKVKEVFHFGFFSKGAIVRGRPWNP